MNPDEIVLVPMTRRQVDYAKEAVQDKYAQGQSPLGLDTVLLLRKAADAPIAEDDHATI